MSDPIVEIEWVDSVCTEGWETRAEVEAKAVDGAMDCNSVGYLLKDEPGFVVIYQGEMADDLLLGSTQIPRAAIQRMKVIGDKERLTLPTQRPPQRSPLEVPA